MHLIHRAIAPLAAAGFAAVLFGVTAGSAQTPEALGGEFQVNTYTTNFQYRPRLALDSDGNFLVVWVSRGSAGTDSDGDSVQGQRYAADGTPIGAQFQVNAYTTGGQTRASVAMGSDGKFVVGWTSYGSPGTDTSSASVQGRRFAADAAALGVEFQINTYTTNIQRFPSIALGATGDFVVVWESYESDGYTSDTNVQGQRFAADGTPLGAEFQVNTYTTQYQQRPAIASNANGDFVVVWGSSGSNGTDTSYTSIQGQRFAADGTQLGGEFQVNSYTTSLQAGPAVARHANGDFVVVWASNGSPGPDTNYSIQGQRYAADGTPLAAQFQVNTYTPTTQRYPSVALNADGDFVVAWQGYGSPGTDTSGASIHGQRYAADGTALGGEFQVNTYTTGFQHLPSVALDAHGDFVVAWQSAGSAGTDTDSSSIQAQRYAAPVVSACIGLPPIFLHDFDTGAEDPAWNRVQDPLDHLTGAGAGLAGTLAGLEVFIDHSPPGTPDAEHFILDRTPNGISDYCAEWVFTPNSADIFGKVKLYAARGDDGLRLLRLMVRENPAAIPPYQLRYSALNDNGKWVNLAWVGLDDVETLIAVTWKQGTGVADGEFRLYLDGTEVDAREDFNNDDRPLGAQAIGNLGLFNAGTLGTLGWDEFASFGD